MTFTESLTTHFPDAIPANQFVGGSQRALARLGVHRGGALPMIATCRDELAFALTAELQRAWGGAFNMAGLAGLFTLGRTGVIAARGHAPVIEGRRTFLVFGLAHLGIDDAGTLGQCERPGVPGKSSTCGAVLALADQLRGDDVHISDYPYLDPEDPEQSRLRDRIAPLVPPGEVDILTLIRIARDLIDQDARAVVELLRDDPVPADVAVFTGIQLHGPRGAEYVDPGLALFDRAGAGAEKLSLLD